VRTVKRSFDGLNLQKISDGDGGNDAISSGDRGSAYEKQPIRSPKIAGPSGVFEMDWAD